jgi:toxin ParE1/3/4
MAREINWSSSAQADIAEIATYLERVSSRTTASSVVDAIRTAAIRQAEFPYAARMVPEFQDPNRRETFVYSYRIIYRVEPDRITILRVVHGKRLLKNVPGSFEEFAQDEYVVP